LRRHGGWRLRQRHRWLVRRFNQPYTWGWKGWTLFAVVVAPLFGIVCGTGELLTGRGPFWRGFLMGFAILAVPVAVAGAVVLWWRLIRFLYRDAITSLDRDLRQEEPSQDDPVS
jgi:hypothetical protein